MINPLSQKRLTYATLSGIFLLGIGAFALLHSTTPLNPLLVAELAFAVYRLGRMVSYDKVMETYRLPFVRTVPDQTGAGDTTEANGRGWREALGDLICCPICIGTWIAGVLVIGLNVLPEVTTVFIDIFCVVGIAELLNGATEFLQWNGQMAREYAGTAAIAKKQAQQEAEPYIPEGVVQSLQKATGTKANVNDSATRGENPVAPPAPVSTRTFTRPN